MLTETCMKRNAWWTITLVLELMPKYHLIFTWSERVTLKSAGRCRKGFLSKFAKEERRFLEAMDAIIIIVLDFFNHFYNAYSFDIITFRSRTKNMVWYGVIGSKEFVNRSYKNLDQRVQLECDGQRIPLPNLQGLVVLNILSYMGGINFWGGTKENDVCFILYLIRISMVLINTIWPTKTLKKENILLRTQNKNFPLICRILSLHPWTTRYLKW